MITRLTEQEYICIKQVGNNNFIVVTLAECLDGLSLSVEVNGTFCYYENQAKLGEQERVRIGVSCLKLVKQMLSHNFSKNKKIVITLYNDARNLHGLMAKFGFKSSEEEQLYFSGEEYYLDN